MQLAAIRSTTFVAGRSNRGANARVRDHDLELLASHAGRLSLSAQKLHYNGISR